MRHIITIAQNTFTELLRNRLLYTFLFFAFFSMMLMIAVGQLSYTEQYRLTLSLGLSSVHLSVVGLTIFIGGSLVYREIDRMTILTLLARPISRNEFLMGKYFGFLKLMLIFVFGFFLIFYANLLLMGFTADFLAILLVFVGIFLEVTVLLALTIFFSTFCASFLAIVFSICLFIIGHWSAGMTAIVENPSNRQYLGLAKIINVALPNLEAFNWRLYPLEHNVTGPHVFWSMVSAIVWVAFFLTAAAIIFRRKDFD